MPGMVLAGVFFLLSLITLAMLFWPRRGLLWRWRKGGKAAERVLIEDTLKYLFKCEMRDQRPTLESVAGMLSLDLDQTSQILERTRERGMVELHDDKLQLTSEGREIALHIIRAHRLWERYLADSTGFSEEEWHRQAEKYEHRLSNEQTRKLSARLGRPTHDPHGDPIPSVRGEVVDHGGQLLSTLEEGDTARVVHIEDEPEALYAQIVAEEIHPQMILRVMEKSPQRIRLRGEGREFTLAPMIANNISVLPVGEGQGQAEEAGLTMDRLQPGQRGEVLELSPRIRGVERRRLLDMGILPGTEIVAELVSPGGDPKAYRIRESVIALRRDQTQHIKVRRKNGQDEDIA